MAINKYVRILDAALDTDDKDQIILRGRIDPHTMDAILVDDYQREVLPISAINTIMKGFEAGGNVPDIDMGMRGHRTKNDSTSYVLLDPTYAIDGQQRVQAAKRYMQLHSGTDQRLPRLGATIHFDTTKEWETERFRILNSERAKVSPNVLLRNARENYSSVKMMHALCGDKSFVMHDRVCWQQRKLRTHLITAMTLVKNVGTLHSHVAPSRHFDVRVMPEWLQRLQDKLGKQTLKDNTKAFYQVLEDCWGIKTVTYDNAPHLRSTFLKQLAMMFTNHAVFWRGNKFFVEVGLLRKLKLFPIQDPQIVQLSGGSGQSGNLLYVLLVKHMNRGKTTKRLVPRKAADEPAEKENDDTRAGE